MRIKAEINVPLVKKIESGELIMHMNSDNLDRMIRGGRLDSSEIGE